MNIQIEFHRGEKVIVCLCAGARRMQLYGVDAKDKRNTLNSNINQQISTRSVASKLTRGGYHSY